MEYQFYLQKLASLGSFESCSLNFDGTELLKEIEDIPPHHWHYYNKSKPGFNRYGLSLFSLDGSDSGEIDLNSIREYNFKHGTQYSELSFKKPTQWWKHLKTISEPLKPIEKHLGRSHLIRLGCGGVFPPHRDLGQSFRLIVFFDCDQDSLHFTIERKVQNFENNRLYYADTNKVHSLVSFKDSSLLLVLNVEPCRETYDFVINNLNIK